MDQEDIRVGSIRRLKVTQIKNDQDAVVDPTTLQLLVRSPVSGATVVYTYPTDTIIQHDALGAFHADVPLDSAGLWGYDWLATGPTFSQGETFWVKPLHTSIPST